MAAEREPRATRTQSKALELAAQVTAKRISNVISYENGSRVMYAIVDLGSGLTSAIGMALAELSRDAARVEVAIHPELAVDGLDDDPARRARQPHGFEIARTMGLSRPSSRCPGRQMEGVLQSLGTVDRVNEAWLCEPEKAGTLGQRNVAELPARHPRTARTASFGG